MTAPYSCPGASTTLRFTKLLPVRAIQRAIEAVTVPLQGEHFTRRPLGQVRAEGLQVIRRERFKLGLIETARRPQAGC